MSRKRKCSQHALARWAVRVDPRADDRTARLAIDEINAQGRVVASNRGWVGRLVRDLGAGCVAIIAPTRPDVALIVRGDTIVTVYSRGCFGRAAGRRHGAGDRPAGGPARRHERRRPKRGRRS